MVISKRRSRTTTKYIYYALQLHFSGLSLRKTAQRLPNLSKESMFPFGIGFSAKS